MTVHTTVHQINGTHPVTCKSHLTCDILCPTRRQMAQHGRQIQNMAASGQDRLSEVMAAMALQDQRYPKWSKHLEKTTHVSDPTPARGPSRDQAACARRASGDFDLRFCKWQGWSFKTFLLGNWTLGFPPCKNKRSWMICAGLMFPRRSTSSAGGWIQVGSCHPPFWPFLQWLRIWVRQGWRRYSRSLAMWFQWNLPKRPPGISSGKVMYWKVKRWPHLRSFWTKTGSWWKLGFWDAKGGHFGTRERCQFGTRENISFWNALVFLFYDWTCSVLGLDGAWCQKKNELFRCNDTVEKNTAVYFGFRSSCGRKTGFWLQSFSMMRRCCQKGQLKLGQWQRLPHLRVLSSLFCLHQRSYQPWWEICWNVAWRPWIPDLQDALKFDSIVSSSDFRMFLQWDMSHGLLLAHRQSPSSPSQLHRYQLQLQNGLVKLIKNSSSVRFLFQKKKLNKDMWTTKETPRTTVFLLHWWAVLHLLSQIFQESPERQEALEMEALQQIPWGMEFSATPPFHGVPCDARALVVSVVSVFREDLWWLLGIRDSDFFCFWFYTLQVCFFNIPRFGVRGAFYFESPLGAFQWLFWSMSFQRFVELWHRAFGWVAPFRSWRIWRSRRSIP